MRSIKKYQNGGKEPEVEKPAEGTMMGDLLRMLEQYKPYDNPEFMDFAKKYDLYDEDYEEGGQKYFDMLYNHFGRDRIVNILEQQIESTRPVDDTMVGPTIPGSPFLGPVPERAEGQFTLAQHFKDLAFSKNSGHPFKMNFLKITTLPQEK